MPRKTILERIRSRLSWAFANHCRPRLLRAASRSAGLSRLYYLLFSSAFRQEQHAVVSGMAEYFRNISSSASSNYLLRRNIHRLEKGMIMRPRRDVYALSYIRETVDAFCRACSGGETEELLWAASVLGAYFDCAKPHPLLDDLKTRFHSVQPKMPDACTPSKMPSASAQVSYADLLSLMRSRKSVRWFKQLPVPRDILDQAVAAAALAPSSCNRQPFEFRLIDDPVLVRKVAASPMGTEGFSENIPVIAVVIGHLQAFFSERDRHLIYIDSSLAAMSFILALEALGVSTCCINWPDMAERKENLGAILRLKPCERPVMLIAAGYRDESGLVAWSQRKPVEELRAYNLP